MENQLKALKVSTFSQIPKKKLGEIKRFVTRCKRTDGYEPLFYWGSIEKRKNPGINDLLCYTETNDIVSYLALYHFEESEIEITLMVDERFRHTSFYEALLAQINRIVLGYPVDITRYVFTCNQKSLSLKEYLSGLGAHCFQFTHKLAVTAKKFALLEKKANAISTITNTNPISVGTAPLYFRKADASDIPALIRLEVDCFQISRELYREQLEQMLQDPNKEIMVAIKNQEIIGKIHIQSDKKKAYLYDLCIATHEQGQGYGALLLWNVLKVLFNRELNKVLKVLIDVEEDAHLKWYKKFNFKCIAIYEHWRMSVHKNPLKERERQLETLLLNFQSHQVQDQLSHSVYKH